MLAFKRVFLFMFVLATLTVFALMPMNVSSAPEQAPELQETVVPVTSVAASPVPSYPIPVTGAPTMSTILIVGLLILIGVIVIIAGISLTNKSSNDLPR